MIAFGVSLGVTSILAIMWFISLPVRFGTGASTTTQTTQEVTLSDSSTQFQTIMSGFAQVVTNAQKALNDAKSALTK